MPTRRIGAFLSGGAVATLGGLIGLGGAEFRLPLLIGLFRFKALEAVIVNKAMSLIVVATALPFRAAAYSNPDPAVRRGCETGRQPVAGHKPADHACRLCPL